MTEREQDLMERVLGEGCRAMNLTLSQRQKDQFQTYYELLIRTNKVMNLTAITDYEDVLVKHFLDSICLAKFIDLNNISTMIDIGTGAGFPGLPLKIMFPHIRTVLADALMKRVGFLNEVIDACSITEIEAVHARAEDLSANPDYREKFDLCVSRAVASLPVLAEYDMPFVRVGGMFAAYKSSDIEEEFEKSEGALKILGGVPKDPVLYNIPGTDIPRSMVITLKTENTPGRYPRKPGIIQKKPLQ